MKAALTVLVLSAIAGLLAAPVAGASPAQSDVPLVGGLSGTFMGPTTGGTTVNIHGDNFTDVTAVRFGNKPAKSFHVLGEHLVVADSPAHSLGVVHIRLTSPAGTSDPNFISGFRYAPVGKSTATGGQVVDRITDTSEPSLTRELSCVSPSFCIGISGRQSRIWDGEVWTSLRLPGQYPYSGVYCASTTLCLAWRPGQTARYDGSSWTVGPAPKSAIRAAWCAADGTCSAIDTKGHFSSLVNGAWVTTSAPNASTGYPNLDCAADGRCIVVDFDGTVHLRGTDGTWTTHARSAGLEIENVQCSDASLCMALVDVQGGTYKLERYENGAWQVLPTPPSLGPTPYLYVTFSCVADVCEMANAVVDTASNAQVARFDGTAWSDPVDLPAAPDPLTLDCANTTWCMAIGTDGYAQELVTGGAGPVSPVNPGRGTLSDLSCSAPTNCALDDDRANATSESDGQWSAPRPVHAGYLLACPTSGFCMSVESDWMTVEQNGTWQNTVQVVPAGDGFTDLDCTSATFCLAVENLHGYGAGTPGLVTTWNGSTWSAPSRVASGTSVAAVSCWADQHCAAATARGSLSYLDGSTWSLGAGRVPVRPASANIVSLSCPDAETCFVGARKGRVVAEVSPDALVRVWDDVESGGMTCATATSCVTGFTDAPVYFAGGQWTAPTELPIPGRSGTAYRRSCPVAGSCVVATSSNAIYTVSWQAGS